MQIGEMLIQAGLIQRRQLDAALEYQESIGGHLGQILVKLGFVREKDMMAMLAERLQIPQVDLEEFEPDPACMSLFPRELIERLCVVPLRKEMGAVEVAVPDPTDFSALDELRMHAGGNVETVLVSPSQARDVINRYYDTSGADEAPGDEENAPPRPSRRKSAASRRARVALTDLVHELERDARLQAMEGGGKKKEEVEQAPPETPPAAPLAPLSARQMLLGLIAALAEKEILTEADVAEALARLLHDREVIDENPLQPGEA